MINHNNFEFLTSDKNCKNDENYKIISKVLSDLIRSGGLQLGTGYCLSMSDMVRTLLKHRGIDSKLIDCQATLSYDSHSPLRGNKFIGFPNVSNPGEIDTHVVVVTSTIPAYLIDASIANKLPKFTFAVIEPIKFNSDNNLTLINAEYPVHGLKATYQQKILQAASYQHQKSIIDRIETDRRLENDINLLKKLNYIGITISLFAVINVFLKIFGIW